MFNVLLQYWNISNLFNYLFVWRWIYIYWNNKKNNHHTLSKTLQIKIHKKLFEDQEGNGILTLKVIWRRCLLWSSGLWRRIMLYVVTSVSWECTLYLHAEDHMRHLRDSENLVSHSGWRIGTGSRSCLMRRWRIELVQDNL